MLKTEVILQCRLLGKNDQRSVVRVLQWRQHSSYIHPGAELSPFLALPHPPTGKEAARGKSSMCLSVVLVNTGILWLLTELVLAGPLLNSTQWDG